MEQNTLEEFPPKTYGSPDSPKRLQVLPEVDQTLIIEAVLPLVASASLDETRFVNVLPETTIRFVGSPLVQLSAVRNGVR